MKDTLKKRLAGLVVAATFAATGTVALASSDDVIPAENERHGDEISTLAQETESGPGKGAIVSAAASAHGKATSEAATARHDDEDTNTDAATGEDTDTQASGKPVDAGAKGLETAAAAKADGAATAIAARSDGKAFGSVQAEAGKARRP